MLRIEKAHALADAQAAASTLVTLPRFMKPLDAAKHVGLGRTTLYEMMNAGQINSHRVRGARLICRESLEAFIAAQSSGFSE